MGENGNVFRAGDEIIQQSLDFGIRGFDGDLLPLKNGQEIALAQLKFAAFHIGEKLRVFAGFAGFGHSIKGRLHTDVNRLDLRHDFVLSKSPLRYQLGKFAVSCR